MSGGRIHILVEGQTEEAMKGHLVRFIHGRRGDRPRVGLHFVNLGGGLNKTNTQKQASRWLRESDTLGVIALTDVYPAFKSAEEARETVASWLPSDDRCRPAVAAHDFEAWLLVGWTALVRRAGHDKLAPWGAHPEKVNGNRPPAHRIGELFGARSRRPYQKPVDGRFLFEQLDLEVVAGKCPEFKRFVNAILDLAGYELLP